MKPLRVGYSEYNTVHYTLRQEGEDINENRRHIREICFSPTSRSMLQNKNRPICTFYWRNTVKLNGYEKEAVEFVEYVKSAFAKVDGALYDFTVDFAPKVVPESILEYFYISYTETLTNEDFMTLTIDNRYIGNVTWFYLNALFRNYANNPRIIVTFCRLAKSKFKDTTVLDYFGFHGTLNLAHVVREKKYEGDYLPYHSENMYSNYFAGFNKLTLDFWLKDNIPLLDCVYDGIKPIYRNNASDRDSQLFNSVTNSIRLVDEKRLAGIYWEEGMDENILLDLFTKEK